MSAGFVLPQDNTEEEDGPLHTACGGHDAPAASRRPPVCANAVLQGFAATALAVLLALLGGQVAAGAGVVSTGRSTRRHLLQWQPMQSQQPLW